MICVCIYCGQYKSKALDACGECHRTPESHTDEIHSIILCFSEMEPHLNFLRREEIEELRESILEGTELKVKPDIFSQAEEAYSAVNSITSPQLLTYFAKIANPKMGMVLLLIAAIILFGA